MTDLTGATSLPGPARAGDNEPKSPLIRRLRGRKQAIESTPQSAYVSITGLRLKKPWHIFRFYRHSMACYRQAEAAPGNLWTGAKTINGVRHTLTVWRDQSAMRAFSYSGAHREAIKAFDAIATGKTFGYETDQLPSWQEAHALWRDRGRVYVRN